MGGVAVIGVVTEAMANHRNKCRGGARKRAVPAVDEAEFAPEIDVGYFDQFYFTGTDFVASKTRADQRHAEAGSHKSFDHADAGKFHRNAELRAVWPEELVEQLPREAGLGNDQRLVCDFRRGDGLVFCQWVAGAHHQHQAIAKDRMCSQARRFHRKSDDADVHSAILNLLDYLSAEIAINANLHGWKPAMEFGEDIGQNVEASCFVGTDRERAAWRARLVSHSAQ